MPKPAAVAAGAFALRRSHPNAPAPDALDLVMCGVRRPVAFGALAVSPARERNRERWSGTYVFKRKISGPTRSLRGDQFMERGPSVRKTLLRQGVDLRDFMHKVDHAFISATAPPSVLPRTGSPDAVSKG